MPGTNGDTILDRYRFAEACERALLRYEASMIETAHEEYKALTEDKKLYFAISALFFGAETQAELDSYMDKSPAELAKIIAENNKRYMKDGTNNE